MIVRTFSSCISCDICESCDLQFPFLYLSVSLVIFIVLLFLQNSLDTLFLLSGHGVDCDSLQDKIVKKRANDINLSSGSLGL